ncbi:myelin protein P0-like isoform X1 [Heterodontus francisci]|uniref:myelin protein P0-like isoform X1 n=1 Tax=Heterodontus francisci TaxID=7792 RepID=UPI00355B78C8
MKPVIKFVLFSSVCFLNSSAAHARPGVTVHTLLSVTGYKEQVVTLPCQLTLSHSELNVVDVTWKKANQTANVAVYSPIHGTSYPAKPDSSRIYFRHPSPRDASLVIANSSGSDAGIYTCSWTTFPDGIFSSQTTLNILDTMPIRYRKYIILGVVCLLLVLGLLLLTHIHVKRKNQQVQVVENIPASVEMNECHREIVYASLNLHQQEVGATTRRTEVQLDSEGTIYGVVKQN